MIVNELLLCANTLELHLANPMPVDNSVNVLRNGFDWESLQNKKVVDIGGGNGHISIDLAKVCCKSCVVLPSHDS